MRGGTIAMSPVKVDVVTLKGGFDQLTPTFSLAPGFCRDARNFECAPTGGYARIGGYERFDGRAKPSDSIYALVQVSSFVNIPTVGQTLTGFTSGATGQIIALGSNYVALTRLTGTFDDGEIVSVGVTTIGLTVTLSVNLTAKQRAEYLNLAADAYRALIGVVPGSGPVRGVVSHIISGVHQVYALRNNSGGTACNLFKATASGWSQITLYNEVAFTAGAVATPAEGDTLTQSGKTSTIKRIVLISGSWTAGNAAGKLIVTTPSPSNYTAGAATIGSVTLTLSGAQTAISLLPGGTFEFDVANFSGQLGTRRIYGCDGVNRAFEFDGTVLVPIDTGATVDTPKHIRVLNTRVFLSIGSSLLGSAAGLPYVFTAIAGAVEIAVGDVISGMLVQPGNQDTSTMGILARNSSGMLYGTDSTTFKFVPFNGSTGAIDYMCQNLSQSYVLDDRGVISFRSAQEFGNFLQSTLTQNIQTYISEKRSLSACSTISKDKSQFRMFFSDGSGLYTTIVNGEHFGSMPVAFSHPFFCAWNGELANGDDVSYVGGKDSGYVYQLDRGSSFDGNAVDASITLNWNAMQSIRSRKRYRRGSVEVQGNTYAEFSFGYSLGYESTEIDQPVATAYESNLGGVGQWDSSNWDEFTWDGRILSPTEIEVVGTAENIQITLSSSADYIYPFTVNSLILHYSMRRGLR